MKKERIEEMNNYLKGKNIILGLSIFTFSILSNTFEKIVIANDEVEYFTFANEKKETDSNNNKTGDHSIIIETNADKEFVSGDLYSLTIKLSNIDGDVIQAGTKISIEIPIEAVDFETIDLTNYELTENFDISIDKNTGKIILTLKKDIYGASYISSHINIGIKGESAKNYEVKITSDINGQEMPISIDYPTIKIKDTEVHPPGIYGYLNKYWGISDKDKGSFTGSVDENGVYKQGIFNRSINRISTFSQLNIMGSQFLDIPTSWEFTFDNMQTLVPETITLIDGGTLQKIPEEYYNIKIISPTAFKIDIIDGFNHHPSSSLELHYQTEVHDDSLVYFNETSNTHKDINDKEVTDTFKLYSKFALVGDSDFFPTLNVEDKTFESGHLKDNNIKQELLNNIKAQDTNDGNISDIIEIDYSGLDPNTVGEYEIIYFVKNSLGNVSRRTATIYITESTNSGEIIVEYKDMIGNEIAPKKTIKGKVNDSYVTEEIEIQGYKIKIKPDNSEGKFTTESQLVTYIYEGLLLFTSAPISLDFGNDLAIPNTATTYDLRKNEGDLIVTDYRGVGSNWSMTGKLLSEMKSTSGHVLFSSLYYKNGESEHLFTENASISIHNEITKDSSPIKISDLWQKDGSGPKLKVRAGEPRNEMYEGKIQWTLQNVPTIN